jgi:1-acyl-sn-glycerol-3-phosphate acyltransferase
MDPDRALRRRTAFSPKDVFEALGAGVGSARQMLDELATRMLGRDFEERLRRAHMPAASLGVDPFGLDPEWAKYALAVAAFFYRAYFRAEVSGLERLPPGRVLVVSNHSGQVPFDGMMIGAALFLDAEPPRFTRSMVEKWSQTLPFVSTLFSRLGQVVGVPENARRLLDQGEAVLVFPEGSRGISKPFSDRYKLGSFGLGFMRLALETGTPIVPVGVVGAEEQYISFANLTSVARLFGMPSFPIIPQWFIPGGQMPLPTKYRLYFGEPMYFDGDAEDDDAVVSAKVDEVKGAIRKLLDEGLAKRRSIFW